MSNEIQVHLAEMYPIMKEMLENGGTVNFPPHGTSMLPMLHDNGDMVMIKKPEKELKKYDLPLYIRPNGSFVLHRVVRKPENGVYTMCGDNQWHVEKGIKHDMIVGVVVSFTRKGRTVSSDNKLYKAYARIWVAIMPLRHLFIGGFRKLKRIIKK